MQEKTGFIPLLLSLIIGSVFIPVLTLALILNEVTRLIVSALLYIKYKNKFKLISDGADAVWGFQKEDSTRNVIIYIVTQGGRLDADKIARFYSSKIKSFVDPLSGTRPYAKLEKDLTKKFGYFCWKDNSDIFDVRNHIRVMNKEKLYTETDVYELTSEFIKDMDESNKPQWEIIMFPRYDGEHRRGMELGRSTKFHSSSVDDGTGHEKSIILVRYNHSFMDGVSFVMLFKEHLSIGCEYSIDPLTFRIPLWKKVILYIITVIYGPFAIVAMTLQASVKTWIPQNATSSRKKYFTSTKPICTKTVRKIRRNAEKASVTNVISIALLKSMVKVLPTNRLVSEMLIADALAILPYPNSHPQNNATCFTIGIPMHGMEDNENQLDRIRKCKLDSLKSQWGPEPLLVNLTMKIFGRFPSVFHKLLASGAPWSVVLSNVPFSKSKCSLKDGTEIFEAGAWTPQPNDMGITVTMVSYGDMLKISGCADSSWLSREELCQIIDGIPKEIEIMEKLCSTTSILCSTVEGNDSID